MSRAHWFVAAGLILSLAVGCVRPAPRSNIKLTVNGPMATTADSTESSAIQPEELPVPREETAIRYMRTDAGVISGQVVWDGPLPDGTASRRLAINPENRGVADVVVWLDGKPDTESTGPRREMQLIQRDLTVRPLVQAGRTGSHLKLLCADDRASFKAIGAADFNILLTQGRQAHRVLDRTGLVEVRSELRSDSLAYIWVFDHDRFALTDKDGRFRLPAVSPGAYPIVIWHPGWRTPDAELPAVVIPVRQQLNVKLGEGQGADIHWKLTN